MNAQGNLRLHARSPESFQQPLRPRAGLAVHLTELHIGLGCGMADVARPLDETDQASDSHQNGRFSQNRS